ncbi:hypothetical protein Tco_1029888 [Tanacetum coccineum]|uniref:Uncharacterized protein n=1 Tax=Tanacetum coccineum TaxID=301880 RepID=A0ABQ5G6I7_9ASTR
MDQDSVHMVAALKVPMIKPGVEKVIPATTAKEKAQKRLELKARSTLLMGIPNEHQLKFNPSRCQSSLMRVLDQTFDRLQKLISQLEIHGETISQEDVNQKFLRSLSPEWNTHTIVWRNKPEIDTLDLDDLYNNLKIYEPEVKGTSSSSSNTQNVAFVSSKSTNSTNGAVTTAHEEMDLRWQMAMLIIRAKRFLKEPLEEVFCEWNRENTRRVVPVETTTSNALVSCDGSGYDWSDQAEEGPTNFALMAYSSTSSNSEVSTDSNCSSSCLENIKILKEQNEQLLKDLRTSKLNAIAYKTGLESVEARLLVYKKNEPVYEEDINVLKREIHLREVAITELRRKLELAQKKDEIQLTVENFKNSSKNLSKLIDCQIVDKCKIEEFVNKPIVSDPTVKKPVVENCEAKASEAKPKTVRKNNGALIIED